MGSAPLDPQMDALRLARRGWLAVEHDRTDPLALRGGAPLRRSWSRVCVGGCGSTGLLRPEEDDRPRTPVRDGAALLVDFVAAGSLFISLRPHHHGIRDCVFTGPLLSRAAGGVGFLRPQRRRLACDPR